MFFKVVFLVIILYGFIWMVEIVWVLVDIGVGIMVWFNLIVILILVKFVLIILKDYC